MGLRRCRVVHKVSHLDNLSLGNDIQVAQFIGDCSSPKAQPFQYVP
jgi:hypothetical protein